MKYLIGGIICFSLFACHNANEIKKNGVSNYYILTIGHVGNSSIGILHKSNKCTSKSFTENIKNGYKTIRKEDAIDHGYFLCDDCFTPQENAIMNFKISEDIDSVSLAFKTNGELGELYGALKAGGGNVGSWEEFKEWFNSPGVEGYKHRKYLYDFFTTAGASIGTSYEDFARKIGLKAKRDLFTFDTKKLREVFNILHENGYTQDYQTFQNGFVGKYNYESRKRVFDLLSENGLINYSYEDFMQQLRE